jgi:hypothetical protein
MTTQNSSYSRILAVWMVLFSFLFGMVFPPLVQAKVEMTIATEGDPGDGLEGSGGGSGQEGLMEQKTSFWTPYTFDLSGKCFKRNFYKNSYPQADYIILPIFGDQFPWLLVYQINSGQYVGGRN